jgi:hypothetical protein
MTKRSMNLPSDAFCDLNELSAEEKELSKITSSSNKETVS